MRAGLRHRLEYGAGRVLLALVNALPERLAYSVVGAAGRLYFRLDRKRQRYALHMLRNAYGADAPAAELRRLARVATGNVFKVILDMMRMGPAIARGRIDACIDLGDVPGRLPPAPFLALTGHLGSWEVCGVAAARLRGEAHAIARVFKNPLLQGFLETSRRRAGLCIHPKRGGVRALARALAEGKVGMQVVDQHQRLRGVRAPFFGEPASCERAAAALALRKGYPIAVGGTVRVGGGFRFRVVMLDAPFTPRPSGDHEADVKAVVAEVNRRLERLVLAWPEQYLWIHNRYRPRPSSEVPDDDSEA